MWQVCKDLSHPGCKTEGTVQKQLGPKSLSEKMQDIIERVGNTVPHPLLMFLYLIIIEDFLLDFGGYFAVGACPGDGTAQLYAR